MKKFFKDKKVLITGHTGFKGSWLTQILLNWEADVCGLGLRPNTEPNMFDVLNLESQMRNYFIDIRDIEKVRTVLQKEKPEIVFHLAAQPIVRESYDDPIYTFSTNVMGMANLLQSINEVDCVRAAVLITTDKVYENKEWIYPYREIDPLGGHDPYSASKAAADIIATSFIKSFFDIESIGDKHSTLIAIARAGNVIGGGDWAKYRIVPDIVRSIYEKNEPVVLRNPSAVRPWEHVLEPLSGYLMLAKNLYEKRKEFVGAWNFGPEGSDLVSVEELTKKGILTIGKGEIEILGDKLKHEAHLLTLDISKAKSELKWKPILDLEKTVEFTFGWYKNFYENSGKMINHTNDQIDTYFNK